MAPLAALLFVFSTASLLTEPAFAACPTNYEEVGGNCFLVLADTTFDYLDARTFCQNQGGDLAIIKDCNLLGSLSTYLSDYPADLGAGLWVGASDIVVEGTFRWNDGSYVPSGAPFWARVNPQFYSPEPSGGSRENCAFISSGAGYYFSDGECEETPGYAPLCEIEPGVNETCPSQYVLVAGRCLEFLSTIDVTWGDARDVCVATGGNLATINDCNLMTATIDHIITTGLIPAYGYWIGGSDAAQEGNWTWTGGSPMAMGAPYWGRNSSGDLEPDNAEGSQDCLTLASKDRFYFADENCGALLAPLCQVAPLPTTAPPLVTTSALPTTAAN